jgi:hypothetical protein
MIAGNTKGTKQKTQKAKKQNRLEEIFAGHLCLL